MQVKNRVFYHVPVNELINDMKYYISLGVNFEIYIDSEFIDSHKPEHIEFINNEFKKSNIFKRIHGPFVDLSPASPDPEIRDISMKRMIAGISICRKLECDNIVLHSHYDPVYHKRHFDDWKNNLKTVWDVIDVFSRDSGVIINIENSEDDTPDGIFHLLEEYPLFKACFDLAHCTIFGTAGWKNILKKYPEGSINEVHISDNDTKEDQHRVLGEGLVDIEDFLNEIKQLGDNIAITVEPHSKQDMLKDIEYMRNFS
jgi:sugar phosphate isomerase/epimerase